MKLSGKKLVGSAAWNHFRKNKPARYALYFLGFLFLLSILAPVLSNEKPWFAKYNGEIYFPAFSLSKTIEITHKTTGKKEVMPASQVAWKTLDPEQVIWAPVRYSPGKRDPSVNDYSAPSMKGHWLGTTRNGSDVLSGLIHGTRISISIGILAMIIASFIGISLGSVAGYFGDHHLSLSRGSWRLAVLGMVPAYFYGFYMRSNQLAEMISDPGIEMVQLFISIVIFTCIVFLFYKAGKLLNSFSFFSQRITVKADSIVSRMIEIFISVPRIVLIISIAAIANPSFVNLIFIIGFTSWPDIARFVRAELLQSRNSEYLENARAMGLPDFRIIVKHALPNALAPATVAIVFGVASAILVESALSFLGIGVPQDVVTWGSLLFAGKDNFEAWWLVVFPGLAIFFTVTAFNLVGDGLRDAMDVKGRIL